MTRIRRPIFPMLYPWMRPNDQRERRHLALHSGVCARVLVRQAGKQDVRGDMDIAIAIGICFITGAATYIVGLVVGYWIGRSDAGR